MLKSSTSRASGSLGSDSYILWNNGLIRSVRNVKW